VTIKLSVDVRGMDRDIRAIKNGYDAMAVTLQNAGQGQVVTSKRTPKRPWEKKAFHGSAIANFLRARGVEPVDNFDEQVQQVVETTLQQRITDALDAAWRTATSHAEQIQEALLEAAQALAQNARDRLARGAVGTNTGRTRDRKKRLVKGGAATRQYGAVPPYGIETGRFVDGIKGSWKRGKPRRGDNGSA